MPTTATVAPHRMRTAEDVVAGLRAFADLIEAGAFPGITGALRADLHVTNRGNVEAAARVVDTDATDSGSGLLKAAASIAGVDLTVYTVDRSRLLRRDPEATATLSERDA